MNKEIKIAAIAHFMCFNRFAFSPYSAMEIIAAAPRARFVRPLSFWVQNGYSVAETAHKIDVPLPHADFYFLRQGQKTNLQLATKEEKEELYTNVELQEEISYIEFPFYDVAHTNCKVRLPKYDLELEKLYYLAQQLSLSIEYQPLHKYFLNSYINNKVIVLPTNACKQYSALLLKHIAEHILTVTSTQATEIVAFELFLIQVMLNAVTRDKLPIYHVPDEALFDIEQKITSLIRVSKLVTYLFAQLSIDIKQTDSLELSYMLERKPIQVKNSNTKKFKGRKQNKM